jgi:hypothetical protein
MPDMTNHMGGTGYLIVHIPAKAVPLYINVFVDKLSKSPRVLVSTGENIVWYKTTTQKEEGKT